MFSFFGGLAKTTATGVVARAAQSLSPIEWLRSTYVTYRARRQYGPYLGGVVAFVSLLTLSQFFDIVRLFAMVTKSVGKIRGNSTTIQIGGPSAKEYLPPSGRTNHRYPWMAISIIVSLISLMVSEVRSRKVPLINWSTPVIRPRRWGAAVLCGHTIRWALGVWLRRNLSPIGSIWATPFISRTLAAGNLSSSEQRQIFVGTPLVQSGPTFNHTHGASAADRNTGTATSCLLARLLGKEPYLIQKSLSDTRKGRDGDRSFHWAKDLAVPPQDFHFNQNTQCAVLTDVDYYIDMPTLLAKYPATYFVFAFQPAATATSVGEYAFRASPSGRWLYNVSGGAEYEHEVWDYSGDTIITEYVGYFSKRVVCYHIDRKRVDDHHCIVMLSVIGQFKAPSWLPTSTLVEGRRLERLRVVFGEHAVLDVMTQEGMKRSVSLIGDHLAVTMPKWQMDAVRAVAMVAKVPITPAMVASNVAPSDPAGLPTERLPPGHAAILASFIRAGTPMFPPVVYPPSESCIPIMFDKHDYDAPVPLAGFGSPLVGSCYTYAASIASDDRCIKGRVEAFHKTREFVRPIPPTLAGYMAEFAERLIPVAHRGHPVSHDDVRDHQDRPSQRAILEEAGVTGSNYPVKFGTFVKKETTPKVSDPRNISQVVPATKLAYATFMYAFHEDVMANQEWYAFNKTPKECAERVVAILKHASHAVLGDGSRFDGHVSYLLRVFERVCMMRWAAYEHHAELNKRMDEQIALPLCTEFGRRSFSGYGRGSGTSETADFNSIDTAFIDYCALRNTTRNGKKLEPDEAWAKLGIYGGDDSLSGDVDPDALRVSAELVGQDYEISVIPRGEMGVEFLNRQFGPFVWEGDEDSMANPIRLLAKLFVGPKVLPDPLERFAERASGYYRMDLNSPVIGEICWVAHQLLGDKTEGVLMPWDGRHPTESNWPSLRSDGWGWKFDNFNKHIPDFDWDRFRHWITAVWASKRPGMLLEAPLCTSAGTHEAVKAKSTAIVGDELVIVPDKGKEEAGDAPESKSSNGQQQQPNMEFIIGTTPELTPRSTPEIEDCDAGYSSSAERAPSPAAGASLPDNECRGVRFRDPSGDGGVANATAAAAPIPEAVRVAGGRVPKVGAGGRRDRLGNPNIGAKAQAPQGKSPKVHDKPVKAKVDPSSWAVPVKRDNEDAPTFSKRLSEWEQKRARVAKRLGVTVVAAKGAAAKP